MLAKDAGKRIMEDRKMNRIIEDTLTKLSVRSILTPIFRKGALPMARMYNYGMRMAEVGYAYGYPFAYRHPKS